VFERFTERARQVVVLAQEEARTLKHNYIGTEHILLGLLREEEGLAARVLASLGVTADLARDRIVRIVSSGEEITAGQIPFTPRAKKILELALREALALGHNYIGTEHILLGLVHENEGVATRVLLDFEADSEKIRLEVIRVLSGPEGSRYSASANAEMAAIARRRDATRTGTASVGVDDFRFVVHPDDELRRLLMAAAGRALTVGRREFGLADLLAAAEDEGKGLPADSSGP